MVTWEVPDLRGRRSAVSGSSAEWKAKGMEGLLTLCRSGEDFIADDHHVLVPESPGGSENARGALFSAFARRGLMVPVGYRKGTRKAAHSSLLRVWRGTDHPDVVGPAIAEAP